MSNQNAWLRNFVIDNLNITKPERFLASEKYEEVGALFEGQTILNGSRARHTATSPLNDIDILWVLDEKSEIYKNMQIGQGDVDIKNILNDIEKHLKNHYRRTNVLILQGQHSVGIYFFGDRDKFSADIVPAIPQSDGKFKIPKTGHMSVSKRRKFYEAHEASDLEWILSHPKAYIQECEDLDKATNGNFRHAVRIVKSWRRVSKKSDDRIKLKSFHLECIIAEIFKENHKFNCLEAIQYFFQNIKNDYLEKPVIPDKAGGRNIDDYISEPEFDISPIRPFLSRALALVSRIAGAEDEETVKNLSHKLTLITPSPAKKTLPPSRVIPISKPYLNLNNENNFSG
jgi:hypothetical protein